MDNHSRHGRRFETLRRQRRRARDDLWLHFWSRGRGAVRGTDLEPRWRGLLRPLAARRERRGCRLFRLPPPVQQAVYELDGTYRRVFNLTLLNMELLFESLDVERPDFTLLLTAEVRFDMDVSSGVVWQRRSVHK